MYYLLTATFLRSRSKQFVKWLASLKSSPLQKSTSDLIKKILTNFAPDINRKAYFFFCEFCRQTGLLVSIGVPGGPVFCVSCGEASPIDSFRVNISRANRLVVLASNAELDSETKSLLLEQAVVMIVTSLEILFRKTYAIIQDSKHVIYGESILTNIYNETRNEFLNFGVTNVKFKRDMGINIKSEIGDANFRLFSSVYSKRHIIIHNASTIDNEYIDQTGCSKNMLKKRVPLTISEVENVISKLDLLLDILNPLLGISILNLIESRILISPRIKTAKAKKEKIPTP